MSIPSEAEVLGYLDRLNDVPAHILESHWLDFKSWDGFKDTLRTACEYATCFANASGGVVIFGVDDKMIGRGQSIHGVPTACDPHKVREAIYNGTMPALDVEVSLLAVSEGSGQLLVVRIAAGTQGPYGTKAGTYKQRIGSACMPLDPRAFIRSQVSSGALDWSGEPAVGVAVADLDRVQMERARNLLRSKDPASGLLDLPDMAFLTGLEAVRNGKVTHAGLLLFGRKDMLASLCPQAQFHYVLLRDETTVARNDIERLPLLEIVERMDQIFQGPLNPEEEIELGLFKMRIPQFPLEAVRESILNALTHRDYSDAGETLVRHSADELSITNPGGFIDGITPQNILRHEPRARNRTLANAFVKLRLVESSGVGRNRIYRSALVFGKRRPEYAATSQSVTLRIFNRGANPRLARMVSELDAKGAQVNLDHLLILDALLQNDFIDVAEAANVLQLTREDSRRVLDAMASAQLMLLERRGHTATATYHMAKGVATALKGKAAYTRTRGLNPVRFAEMVREYLHDHHSISNRELRVLLGLGESDSASVEASRFLRKWSDDEGFLRPEGAGKARRYVLKSDA